MSSLERECALSIWRVRIVEGYDLGIWVVPRIIFVPCMESLCMGRFLCARILKTMVKRKEEQDECKFRAD